MREFGEAERGMMESGKRVLDFLMQPRTQAKMAGLLKAADALGVGDRKVFDPEFWRASQRRMIASNEAKKIQVEHWDELEKIAQKPQPKDVKLKPWQETYLRLRQEEAAARKERDEIIARVAMSAAEAATATKGTP